jgi:hypothetical protein
VTVLAPVPNGARLTGDELIRTRDAVHNRATADWAIPLKMTQFAVLHVAPAKLEAAHRVASHNRFTSAMLRQITFPSADGIFTN